MAKLLLATERQAVAAGRVCGVDTPPRETHAEESFLVELRRGLRAALMQSV